MKIHIVGCGGIGSYFALQIHTLKQQAQLPDTDVIIYDNDEVENKNLLYQNYTMDDVFGLKSEILALRYGFTCVPRRVEKFDLIKTGTRSIICLCVDNIETRKAFFQSEDFKLLSGNPGSGWIDMRCQGAQVAMFTSSAKNTSEKMLNTLPAVQEEGTASCQYAQDLFANRIQQGNKIIAAIGSQAVLNIFRGEKMTSSFIHGF